MVRRSMANAGQRRRSSILVLSAFPVVVLIGMAVLAVEVGYINYCKIKLQAAADVVALAWVAELRDSQATAVGDDPFLASKSGSFSRQVLDFAC